MGNSEKLAETILKRQGQLDTARGQWDINWQELATYLAPARDFSTQRTKGALLGQQVYDSTGIHAARTMADSLHGLLTNPALKWFDLRMVDEMLNERPDVKRYTQEVTNIILSVLNTPSSGFNTNIGETYLDDVVFGTSCLFIDRSIDKNGRLRVHFQVIPLNELYLVPGGRGDVGAIHRKFVLSSDQFVDLFSEDNIPSTISDKIGTPAAMSDENTVIHAIMPSDDPAAKHVDNTDFEYISVYVTAKENTVIRQSGYNTKPFAVNRTSVKPGEVYGRSFGMDAIFDVRSANIAKRTILIGSESAATPPIAIEHQGVMGRVNTRPRGITYYPRGGRPPQTLNLVNDLNPALQSLRDDRENITKAFFGDILTLPLQDRMTTVEIRERQQSRMQLLSRVLARTQEEKLDPIIARVYDILRDANALPELPADIEDSAMEVQYTSPLARSQRSSEIVAFDELMARMGPLADADPLVMGNFDFDDITRWLADGTNLPVKLLVPKEVQAQNRQAAAQQQQLNQAVEAAPPLASAMKDGMDAAETAQGISPSLALVG